jgi:MFS family permease
MVWTMGLHDLGFEIERAKGELPPHARAVLVIATFTTALAFSVILPSLPSKVALAAGSIDAGILSLHTGLIAGIYTLSAFMAAPVLGRLSDTWGRRPILVMGLTSFCGSLVIFEFADDLLSIYFARAIGGFGSGAVTPVSFALIGDFAPDDGWRARRFAWMSAATMTGFMTGPLLGGLALPSLGAASSILHYPLIWLAGSAFLSAIVLGFVVPARRSRELDVITPNVASDGPGAMTTLKLLWLAAIIAGCVAAFDLALTLQGAFVPNGGAAAVMLLAQTARFSPLVRPHATRWMIAPALGLATFPSLTGATVTLVGIGLVAAAGVAAPAITHWTSVVAGDHQGQELGRWTAATSLGQAVGSASAGLLVSQGFNLAVFAFSAVASVIGMLLALPLAGKLARPNVDHSALARIAPGRPR